jgi:uncharacterized protein YjbJ (UPF0337 family)
MKNSTKESAKGTVHELAGKAKVVTGKAIRSPGLEADGEDEIIEGKILKKSGQVHKILEK